MILCKPDVRFKRLTPEIVRVFPILERVWEEHAPLIDVVITSANDSTHKPKNGSVSYHYTDYAIDVRSKNLTPGQKHYILVGLQAELRNDNYDVILENVGLDQEHFHIEFNARKLGA